MTATHPAVSQQSSASSRLEVHVNYTGSGTVDAAHKIYIMLWDTPDFATGAAAMPMLTEATESKRGTVAFTSVGAMPVYVSAVYDPSGQWDAQSVPPDGSSLGVYSKTPGKPEPVNLSQDKTSKIELPFDDSFKMQSGVPKR